MLSSSSELSSPSYGSHAFGGRDREDGGGVASCVIIVGDGGKVVGSTSVTALLRPLLLFSPHDLSGVQVSPHVVLMTTEQGSIPVAQTLPWGISLFSGTTTEWGNGPVMMMLLQAIFSCAWAHGGNSLPRVVVLYMVLGFLMTMHMEHCYHTMVHLSSDNVQMTQMILWATPSPRALVSLMMMYIKGVVPSSYSICMTGSHPLAVLVSSSGGLHLPWCAGMNHPSFSTHSSPAIDRPQFVPALIGPLEFHLARPQSC